MVLLLGFVGQEEDHFPTNPQVEGMPS
jgi:hypothetical protein